MRAHGIENTPSVERGRRLHRAGVSAIEPFRLHGPVVKGIPSKGTVDSKGWLKLASTAILKNC